MIECVLTCVLLGGIGGTCPLLMSLAGLLLGGERTKVSKHRRPPMDSDLRIGIHLFLIGSGIGLALAWMTGGQTPEVAWVALAAGFFVGNGYGFWYARSLNTFYLRRAHRCMEEGDARGALEDAREVARSSDALAPQANSIVETASQMSMMQPLTNHIEIPPAEPA